MTRRAILVLCLSSLGCSGSTPADGGLVDAGTPDSGRVEIDLCTEEIGALFGPDCASAATRLRPVARIDGAWVGRDAACTVDPPGLRCPTSAGTLLLEVTGENVRVGLEASADTTVEGLVAEGPVVLDGATTWLSNGFQSWSQSGALRLGELPDDDTLFATLGEMGDTEVLRTGRELSWEMTVVGGGPFTLLGGALDSSRFRPWTQAGFAAGVLTLRLGSGGVERVPVRSGETVWGEPFRVELGADTEALLRAHAAALPALDGGADAEAGWNSWYELWDGVDETAIRANAAQADVLLSSRVGGRTLRVVIDDGWQLAWGDWFPNGDFPSGLDGLANDLRADGFEMGVWLAPLLVAEDSEVATLHPEWLVGGAVYEHAKNGSMHVLDVTHPEAAAHLRATIERIVSWGYGLLKIDFLFAGTFEGDRVEDVTGMEAYHRALTIIREAAGTDALLLTVGSPGLASLPYSDAWRVGGDIALEPFGAGWAWIPNQARVLAARFPYCLRVLCDADPPILREPLTREEVESGAWVVAFSGGALFLSDDLRALASERADWALTSDIVSLSLGRAPAYPEDFLPANPPGRLSNAIGDHLSRGSSTHVVPVVWRAPDGTRHALNVTEAAITIEGVEVPPRARRALPR